MNTLINAPATVSRGDPTLPTESGKLSTTLPDVPGYAVEGVLGGGGMGVVYRAIDLTLRRPVALKMIAAEHAGPATRERFRIEARTVARLRHPNIVQIYEVGEHEGRPFLALEFVDGGSLAQHLAAHGPLPPRDAALLVASLARAMEHAHDRAVVHRDLKPANILIGPIGPISPIGPIGTPKIADFGLAKVLDADHLRTRSGAVLGTPAYMAPEQARGDGRAVTPLADVYALGVILYECLTGRPPFNGESAFDVLLHVISTDAPPPSRFRSRLARDLDTICLKCLQKDPARRYSGATALADDLERFAAGEAIAARPDGPFRKLGRKLRRHPIAVALAILLTGGIALAGGFWELCRAQAEADLAQGCECCKHHNFAGAARCDSAGLARLENLPGCSALRDELFRAWAAAELRSLAETLMFKYDPDHLGIDEQRRLADTCRKLWDERHRILGYADTADPTWEAGIRSDLRDVALRRLEILLRLGARDEALALVNELEAFDAPSQLIELERAMLREDALPDVDMTLPQSATEFHHLSRTLRRAGRTGDAAECLRSGLELQPQALELHFELATMDYAIGQYESAATSYSVCVALLPASPTLHARLGFAHLALGRTTRALADFDRALKRDRDNAEALFGRARTYQHLSRLKEARADYEAALSHDYPPERVLYPLAVTLLDARAADDARRRLQQLLALRPDHRDALDMMKELDRRTGHRNP